MLRNAVVCAASASGGQRGAQHTHTQWSGTEGGRGSSFVAHMSKTHTHKKLNKNTHTRSVTQTQAKKTIPHVGLCSPSLQAAGLHTHAASQFIATPHPSTPQQRAPATLTLPPLLPPPPPPPPALDDPACSTCDHSATTPTLTTISCNDERLLALPRSEC